MATEIASAYVALYTRMPGVQKDISDSLDKVDSTEAGEKIGTDLGKGITNKQAAIAGAVGGLMLSVGNAAATAVGDLFADAIDMSDATDKFAKTLDFAGLDTSAIDAAMTASRDYADSTVYDLSTIQNTTAQLAANGIDNYTELTEAAGNLNAIAGGNASTFDSVAGMLSQTAGAGKLTTENWNQLADAIPGASGRLQSALEEAGAYTGNFRDAMEKGEITADEFNDAIVAIGTEPVAVAAATSVETMEGATGNLAAAITGQLADAFDVIKPVLTGFTTIVADFIANSDIFVPVIAGLAAVLLAALAPAIWAAVTATWAFTTALLANPMTWIVLGIGLLVAAFVALAMNWDTVVAWITEVWGGFIGWITGVIDGFVGWWNDIWATVGTIFSDVWGGFVGIVKDIWNGVLGWIEDGVNGAIDLINGLTGGARDILGVIGIEVGEIPNVSIPELAEGGIVRGSSSGTLALIGEAGRGRDEAVVPLPEGWQSGGFGGGGVQVDVHPSPGMDEVTIGQVAARELSWQLRGA